LEIVRRTAAIASMSKGFPKDLLKDASLLKCDNYVDGKYTSGDKERFSVVNPANGNEVAKVSNAGQKETRAAIEAADRAFQSWKNVSAMERSAKLRKWYELIMENVEDLGTIMTVEQGKPKPEAMGEVKYAASYVEWFSAEALRIYGDYIEAGPKRALVMKQPVGVCAAITPWNFPAAMLTRKAAAAIAAGCTIVAKPATMTPLTALALAELARRAEIPPGVLNVVCGNSSKEVGGEMTGNPKVRKITFTGSTNIGKILMEQAAGTVKRMSMELGGLAPLIVMGDANIDLAAECMVANKFRNGGQTCICANRIYVHEDVKEQFVSKARELIQELKVGNGLDEGVKVGPMINKEGMDKTQQHVDDAIQHGANLLVGGKALPELGDNFYAPTLLSDVTDKCLVASEETFGPVAPIFSFKTEDEVIERANNTIFGLASYLFTENLAQGIRMSERLEYGMVGLNEAAISDARMPFGGVKQSGQGREGSKYGLDDYTEMKYVCIGKVTG